MLFADKTILIVEDEDYLRRFLEMEFNDLGANTCGARDGQEAWQIIESQPVDFVLSDIRMPGAGGIDLLDRVRAMAEPKPRVFLVTGYAEIDTQEAVRRGAVGIIRKPFEVEDLASKMAELLNT